MGGMEGPEDTTKLLPIPKSTQGASGAGLISIL